LAGISRVLRAIITALIGLAFAVAPVSAQPQAASQTNPAEFWMSGAAVQGGLVIGRAPKGASSVFLNDAALELRVRTT
jgi:hypothetical protein